MLVYKISFPGALPSISNWLNPNYHGPGDLYARSEQPNINDPKNWRKDFPKFYYEFEDFIKDKNKLNAAKSKLDPIHENTQLQEVYSYYYISYFYYINGFSRAICKSPKCAPNPPKPTHSRDHGDNHAIIPTTSD